MREAIFKRSATVLKIPLPYFANVDNCLLNLDEVIPHQKLKII